MKELVGKIYRDENGVETIESINRMTTRQSLWKEEKLPDYCGADAIGFAMVCPQCGEKYLVFAKTDVRKEQLRHGFPRVPKNTFCGCCGHRNVIEFMI